MADRYGFSAWGAALIVGLALIVGAPAVQAGPGHDHGDHSHDGHDHGGGGSEPIGDIAPRVSAEGSVFQLVGRTVPGALGLFVDTMASNLPVTGAYVEVMAGDASLVAEEVTPGFYVASPWPPQEIAPENLIGTDLIVTIVAAQGDDLLLAPLPDEIAVPDEEARAAIVSAEAEDADGASLAGGNIWLLLLGLLVAIAGAVVGSRNQGAGRWIGAATVLIGVVIGVSSTGFV